MCLHNLENWKKKYSWSHIQKRSYHSTWDNWGSKYYSKRSCGHNEKTASLHYRHKFYIMHFSVHRLEQCFCITSEFHVIYANPIIMIFIKAKINIFGEDMHCRWNVLSAKWLSTKWLSTKRTVGKTYRRQNELSAKRTVSETYCRQNELSAKRLSTKCTVDEMNVGEMNASRQKILCRERIKERLL